MSIIEMSPGTRHDVMAKTLSGHLMWTINTFRKLWISKNVDVSEIKRAEATRVLDSIADLTADNDFNDDSDNDNGDGTGLESGINKIKQNINYYLFQKIQCR